MRELRKEYSDLARGPGVGAMLVTNMLLARIAQDLEDLYEIVNSLPRDAHSSDRAVPDHPGDVDRGFDQVQQRRAAQILAAAKGVLSGGHGGEKTITSPYTPELPR